MRRIVSVILVLAASLTLGAAPAMANRTLLDEKALTTEAPFGPPQGEIEGSCGVAVSSGSLYVSDYYHRVVDRFSGGAYASQIVLPGGPILGLGVNSLDGVCGLASDSAGNLYANEWHQGVSRLLPTARSFDKGHESTGVAVDPVSGDVYVDDRTFVAVYEPSGSPVEVAGQALRIGVGSLEDAYGVAVFGGRVYVPDAGSNTVEVFEPAVDPAVPVAAISHGFVSLDDAAVAVDPTTGHVVVASNSQPGFEHPEAALYEFDSDGSYLGQLGCGPVDAEPSGLAFASDGTLYVTNGNSENANLFKYGAYTEEAVPRPSCAAVALAGGKARSASVGDALTTGAPEAPSPGPGTSAASASSVIQQHGVRVSFSGGISPKGLPRHGFAGVHLDLATGFSAAGKGELPQLRRVTIEFNRAGQLHPDALPLCPVPAIQPSTTAAARAACGHSIIGEGHFSADVRLPSQSPFPAEGKVIAFNGTFQGRPAILAHVYGTKPVPSSFTLPFTIGQGKGTFGTVLRAALPEVTGNAAAITGLTLKLGRNFTSRGHRRSYITAGCPVPKGLSVAAFPLARGRFAFAGGLTMATTQISSCRARG